MDDTETEIETGESIVIQSLKKFGDFIQSPEGKEKLDGFAGKIKEVMDKIKGMSEEDQAVAHEEFASAMKSAIKDAFSDRVKKMLLQKYGLFVICALVVLILFVYFGYKIYRSMTEKDRKRAEKLKLKEERKKKK